eukprot:365800-Chlamydomonas_euryale.AAC.36
MRRRHSCPCSRVHGRWLHQPDRESDCDRGGRCWNIAHPSLSLQVCRGIHHPVPLPGRCSPFRLGPWQAWQSGGQEQPAGAELCRDAVQGAVRGLWRAGIHCRMHVMAHVLTAVLVSVYKPRLVTSMEDQALISPVSLLLCNKRCQGCAHAPKLMPRDRVSDEWLQNNVGLLIGIA